MNGITTTMTSWNAGVIRLVKPPRSTVTKLSRGATLGRPHDAAQQRRILAATLDLLGAKAPLDPVLLDESDAEAVTS